MKTSTFILIFILVSSIAFAGNITFSENFTEFTYGDTTLQLEKVEPVVKSSDEIFKKLKVNDATKRKAIFSLEKGASKSLDKLDLEFVEVCGHVKSYDLKSVSTCSREVLTPVYETKEVCRQEANNYTKSVENICSQEKVKVRDDVSYESYECYKDITSLDNGDYYIDADIEFAKCADGTYGYKVDWIPKVEADNVNFKHSKWAWWNVSYDSKVEVLNITNVDLALPIEFNSEIVWFNPSQCNGKVEIYYDSVNTSDLMVVCNESIVMDFEIEGNPIDSNVYSADIVMHMASTLDSTSNITFSSASTDPATGIIGDAFNFDGTSNYYLLAETVSSGITSSDTGTICAQVYIDDYAVQRQIVSFGVSDKNSILQFYLEANGILTATAKKEANFHWGLDTDAAIAANQWLSLCLVQDGVSPVIYVNGQAPSQNFFGQISLGAWLNDVFPIDTMGIGVRKYNSGSASNHFDGRIDEVRVYSRALSVNEINLLQNSGMYLGATEVFVDYDRKVPILNATGNLALPIKWNNSIVWLNPSDCSGAVELYYLSTDNSMYELRCNGSTMQYEVEGKSSNPSIYTAKTALHMHKLSDSTGTYSYSNTNIGLTDGMLGKGYSMNGASKVVGGDITSSPLSLSLWFNPSSAHTGYLVTKYSASNKEWRLYTHADGYIQAYVYDSSASYLCALQTSYDVNSWNHLAFTIDNSNCNLYHNGLLANSTTSGGSPLNSAESIVLGSSGDNNVYFNGKMDEFRIYDSVLSSADVSRLYSSGVTYGAVQSLSGINETEARAAIKEGIMNITSYDFLVEDQLLTVFDLNGNPSTTTFDVFVGAGSKRWAFNFNETGSYQTFNNLTPVFYNLQMVGLDSNQIRSQVIELINQTK